LEELRRRDLPPFAAAIKAGTIAIMPSHLRLPELTGDLPATVSGAALTGLLRGELGFTGVVVCDALEMRATRDAFGIPGAAVLAVAAGTAPLCPGGGGGGGGGRGGGRGAPGGGGRGRGRPGRWGWRRPGGRPGCPGPGWRCAVPWSSRSSRGRTSRPGGSPGG